MIKISNPLFLSFTSPISIPQRQLPWNSFGVHDPIFKYVFAAFFSLKNLDIIIVFPLVVEIQLPPSHVYSSHPFKMNTCLTVWVLTYSWCLL